jgi:transcriptional regulator with XRE-family HTH domain
MATNVPEPSPFSLRMKTARLAVGISQMELGVRAGIDECSASARINQYERGKHAPDFLTVRNLARVLAVPTAYFYTEEDDLAELLLTYGGLTTSKRTVLLSSAIALRAESPEGATDTP